MSPSGPAEPLPPPLEVSDSPYTYLMFLASGGMGRVDLAMREVDRFCRFYAIKHLHPHLVQDRRSLDMFREEARIASSLSHPNVVGVHDYGRDSLGPYLAMDYVEGLNLARFQRICAEQGELPPLAFCVRVALDIARGLDAIHQARDPSGTPLALVHRDLSPKNVLLGFDGGVRVTDFGIARARDREVQTTTGLVKGTVGYLAPERLRFQQPTSQTDLFSLGVVLFELLSGERLYSGGVEECATEILSGPVPDIGEFRLESPPPLTALLFQLLAKDPADRPDSAAEVVMRLEAIRTDFSEEEMSVDVGTYVSVVATTYRVDQRRLIDAALEEARHHSRAPQRWSNKTRMALGAAGVALVAAVAGLGYFAVDRAAAPAVGAPSTPELSSPPRPAHAEAAEPLSTGDASPEPADEPAAVEPAGEAAVAEPADEPPARGTGDPRSEPDDSPARTQATSSPRRARRRRRRGRRQTPTTPGTSNRAPVEMTWTGEVH